MTLKETKCKYCNQFFFYEDGLHKKSLCNPTQKQAKQENLNQNFKSKPGRCPRCIDPHRIKGFTFFKSTILRLFRKHLTSTGINASVFDEDTLKSMMSSFPKLQALYNSNGTYITVTLGPGFTFEGRSSSYRIESYKMVELTTIYQVRCLKCSRLAQIEKDYLLRAVTGIHPKGCVSCDNNFKKIKKPSNHKRNTSGLRHDGRPKSDKSERARAKMLNVSRNDLRRHGDQITERVEELSVGTVVYTFGLPLKIYRAFWDEESMTPKYELVCERCDSKFTCIQKHVDRLSHPKQLCDHVLSQKASG